MHTNTSAENVTDTLTESMSAEEVTHFYSRLYNIYLGDSRVNREGYFQMEIQGALVDALIFEHHEALRMRDRLIHGGIYAPGEIAIRPYSYLRASQSVTPDGASELVGWEIEPIRFD